jgi:hypothetical protein
MRDHELTLFMNGLTQSAPVRQGRLNLRGSDRVTVD